MNEVNTEKSKQDQAKRPLGVLVLSQTYSPDVGGVETHLTDLTEAFQRQHPDWRVWIVAYKPIVTEVSDYQPKEQQNNVTIRRFWWIGGNLFRKLEKAPVLMVLYIVPYFMIRLFFYMAFRMRQVDVIHVHGINMALVGLFFATLFNKRVVFQSHALYSFSPGSLFAKVTAFLLKRMDAVLTLCQASKDEFVRLGVPAEKITVYRYWIDLNRFNPVDRSGESLTLENKARCSYSGNHSANAESEAVLTQSRNKDSLRIRNHSTNVESEAVILTPPPFTAFFIGRLIGIKGEDVVIELARRFPKVHFKIAGGGPNQQLVIDAAKAQSNIEYIGLVPNQQVQAYYQSADVVLVPSQYPEGFGRVICEALACGTPVLASNIGGIPDAMDNTVGVLCDLDVDSFAKALDRMVTDREWYESLQRNCRPYAERQFSSANAEMIFSKYCGQSKYWNDKGAKLEPRNKAPQVPSPESQVKD
jgi:glycosyltransferase involved in cell wall biosynthesis